jgi:hypothetical protein
MTELKGRRPFLSWKGRQPGRIRNCNWATSGWCLCHVPTGVTLGCHTSHTVTARVSHSQRSARDERHSCGSSCALARAAWCLASLCAGYYCQHLEQLCGTLRRCHGRVPHRLGGETCGEAEGLGRGGLGRQARNRTGDRRIPDSAGIAYGHRPRLFRSLVHAEHLHHSGRTAGCGSPSGRVDVGPVGQQRAGASR